MGAAVAFLPSCVYKQDQVHIQLKNLQISPEQEKLLTALGDQVIPKTTSPGSSELGLQFFALKIADDCFDAETRKQFSAGLTAYQDALKKDGSLTLQKAAEDEKLKGFVNGYKSLIIKGYMQSEYYMTKVVPYKLIPGPYRGCVPA